MNDLRIRHLAFLVMLLALAPAPAAAQVELTRIADQSTASPSAPPETFSGFGEGFPVISGSVVSFYGDTPSGTGFPAGGIYVGDGGPVTTIADRSTDDPDGSAETFQSFEDGTWIAGEWVVFVGRLLGMPGVYLSNGSLSATIAEHGDSVPGSAETFTDFRGPRISPDGGVGFWAQTSGGTGVYLVEPLSRVTVADESTPIPGGSGETFSELSAPILTGGEAIFRGSNFTAGRLGLYGGSGGPLRVVVDDSVSPPGESATFSDIGVFTADDGAVAFTGSGTGFHGLYLADGSGLVTLVDGSASRPGGGTFASGFDSVALSGETVIFVSDRQLYSWHDGAIERLVGAGDSVDGRTVLDLYLSPGGLDGTLFTVVVGFTDDSVGIYRGEIPIASLDITEIPTLGEWGLILLALGLAGAAAFVLRSPA